MLQSILANMNGLVSTTERKNRRRRRKPLLAGPAGPAQLNDFRLEAVARVLASPHFRASERNKQFLKFVVEETVAGRAERIKAFTVAVDVFGRDSSFDASVDPIVRIAAGHLRRSLNEYYSTHGKADPVRITLPLGTYVPTFTRRQTFSRRAMGRLRSLVASRKARLKSGAVGAAMALAAAAAAVTYLSVDLRRVASDRPVIVVAAAKAQPYGLAAEGLANLFTQSLWIALNSEKSLRVVGVGPQEDFRTVLAQTQANFGSTVPLYQLLSTIRLENDRLHVYWHVLDGRSNETYLSTSTIRELGGQMELAPEAVAREVAASLNDLAGVKAVRDNARSENGLSLPWSAAPQLE